MNICVSVLYEKIYKYDRIAIYGCGTVAKETYHALLECGKKPEFCVVTKKQRMTQELFQNAIPVYEFEDMTEYINKNNVLVITGVSEYYEEEILEILRNAQIKHYVCITDFERGYVYRRYENMSEQEYLDEIAEWYVNHEGHTDKQHALEILQDAVKGKHCDNKIVFAVGALTPRLLKIAESLQKRGYEIKLIASPQAAMQEFCIDALRKIQITCVNCTSVVEFMYRLMMERAKVIHLFTTLGNSRIDRILIKMKGLFPPIIYDEYDIYNLCYTGISEEHLENERFCLEHAEAICNRGYEVDHLIRNGYHIGGKVIQLSDYCGNEQICDTDAKDSELSLCYCGNILSREESTEWVQNFSDLAGLCAVHHCHFHLYPHIWNEERLSAYIELDRSNDFFHLHQPVPYDQLKNELSKHDYGIYPMKRIHLEQGMIYNQALSARYGTEVITYAHTNKYFDYLDAGLPIIAVNPIQLVKFLQRKGVVLDWTIEEYNFDEMRSRRKELKERVKNAHYGLQMSQHIDELLQFYVSVENERIERQRCI